MNARTLLCVCGAAAAIISAPALAQQGTTPSTPRPDASRQPANTTPSNPTPQQRDAMGQPGATNTADVLSRLEGVWKVEVSMNESWSKASGMKGDKSKDGMSRPDANRPDANRPDANRDPANNDANRPAGTQPGDKDRDGMNPSDAQRTDRDSQTGRPAGMTSTDSKSFTGYAERRLVLGENILQESIVIPAMGHDGMKQDNPANRPQDTMRTSDDQNAFRGMSFLSFNEENDTYRIIFMDSKHNDIHVDSGEFDASRSRIVFHGESDKSWKSDSSHKTTGTPGTKSDPADFARQPGRDKDMKITGKSGFSQHGDVRVVLEIIGADQHQVTMYKVGTDANRPGESRTGTPSTTTTTPASGQPDAANRPDGTRPDTMRDLPSNAESIVYRAVYTRATGAEATRFRQLIDSDRSLTRANSTDR